MPGNENNPSLQDAGTSAGAERNSLPPPAQGVQQPGERVPYPTLQAVANLHITQMEDLLQLEREVMLRMEQKAIRRFRMEATDVPQFREPRIPSLQSLVTGCPGIKINIC